MPMPEPAPVTALDLTTAEALDGDLEAYFAKCQEKLGFVPNVLRAYAWNPEKLRTFIAFYDELMMGPSGLTKLEREMIAVAVSSANNCTYCRVAHGAALRRLSGDAQLDTRLAADHRAAALTPRQVAMLDFAVRLTERADAIGEADRETLRAHGFSDADIWDIAEVAGFFNMSNRLASAVDMVANREYHDMAR